MGLISRVSSRTYRQKQKNGQTSHPNQVDMKGSRGTANHCQKIGGKDCSVNILEDKIAAYNLPREDDGDDNDKIQLWQTIVAFECRGCEVSEFMFSDGWTVQGTDGGE